MIGPKTRPCGLLIPLSEIPVAAERPQAVTRCNIVRAAPCTNSQAARKAERGRRSSELISSNKRSASCALPRAYRATTRSSYMLSPKSLFPVGMLLLSLTTAHKPDEKRV